MLCWKVWVYERWEYRDDYEVQWSGREGGGSVVWLPARVLCGCEARCEVLVKHGAGGGNHKDKQSQRCCAPILNVPAKMLVYPSNCLEVSLVCHLIGRNLSQMSGRVVHQILEIVLRRDKMSESPEIGKVGRLVSGNSGTTSDGVADTSDWTGWTGWTQDIPIELFSLFFCLFISIKSENPCFASRSGLEV